MVHGTASPIAWMLELRRFRLKIHYNNTTPGYMAWEGEDRIQYKDIQFTIQDFRGFVYRLVDKAHQILFHDLLLVEPVSVPTIRGTLCAMTLPSLSPGRAFCIIPVRCGRSTGPAGYLIGYLR